MLFPFRSAHIASIELIIPNEAGVGKIKQIVFEDAVLCLENHNGLETRTNKFRFFTNGVLKKEIRCESVLISFRRIINLDYRGTNTPS